MLIIDTIAAKNIFSKANKYNKRLRPAKMKVYN